MHGCTHFSLIYGSTCWLCADFATEVKCKGNTKMQQDQRAPQDNQRPRIPFQWISPIAIGFVTSRMVITTALSRVYLPRQAGRPTTAAARVHETDGTPTARRQHPQ